MHVILTISTTWTDGNYVLHSSKKMDSQDFVGSIGPGMCNGQRESEWRNGRVWRLANAKRLQESLVPSKLTRTQFNMMLPSQAGKAGKTTHGHDMTG